MFFQDIGKLGTDLQEGQRETGVCDNGNVGEDGEDGEDGDGEDDDGEDGGSDATDADVGNVMLK